MPTVKKDRVKRTMDLATDAAAGEVKVRVIISAVGENAALTGQVVEKVLAAIQQTLLEEGAPAGA